MTEKSILLLSPFFFPELISTGKYNTSLAEALHAKGVQVGVIASHPLYPDWNPRYTEETVDGIQVHRGGMAVRYPASPLIRRFVLETWFAAHVLIKLVAIKKKGGLPDIMLPIFPPSLFFLGCLYLLPSGIKKVGIVHDLQGIHASGKKGMVGSLVRGAIRFVEGKVFSGCDRIIFLSREMMHEAVKAYGLDPEACEVIYPPASLMLQTLDTGTKLRMDFPDGYKHIVYAGALGEKQDPDRLVVLFHETLNAADDVMFHFFSRGPAFERIRHRYAGKTKRILFHDLVEEAQLPELYARSDVQIVPQRAGTSKGSLPSKLPNLIAAGVRILGITDEGSELSEILSGVDGAVVIHGWEEQDFMEGLSAAMDDAKTHEQRRLLNAPLVAKSFSTDALVDAIIRP